MAFERGSVMRGVAAGVLALSMLGVTACASNKAPKTFSGQDEKTGFNPFKRLGGGEKAPAVPEEKAFEVPELLPANSAGD